MSTNHVKGFGLVIFVSQFALADASYQSSLQVTGGALVDALRSNPLAARVAQPLLAPAVSLTMVHGNQKAAVTKESTEIIDLDKGTITHIDTAKKAYSVMTFDQMRQAMKNLPQQMEQAQSPIRQAQSQMPKIMSSKKEKPLDIERFSNAVDGGKAAGRLRPRLPP